MFLPVLVAALSMTQEKSTFLVLLVRPENAPTYSAEHSKEIQAGHMAHLTKLFNAGTAKVAGPFMEEHRIRGIVLIEAKNVEMAKMAPMADPAIKAGRLAAEVYPWAVAPVKFGTAVEPMQLVTNTMVLIERVNFTPKSFSSQHALYQSELGNTLISGVIPGEFKYIDAFIVPGEDKAKIAALAAKHPAVVGGYGKAVVLAWGSAKGVVSK
jgi:uncharacterized protein YciI